MGLFLLQITSIHLRLAQKKRKCISFYNWKLQGLASGKDEPKNPPNLPGICFSIFFYSLGWLSFMLDFFSSTFSPRAENIPETWSFLGSLSLWRQKKRLLVTQPIPPRTPIGPCLDLLAFLVSREWSALSGQLDHLRHLLSMTWLTVSQNSLGKGQGSFQMRKHKPTKLHVKSWTASVWGTVDIISAAGC